MTKLSFSFHYSSNLFRTFFDCPLMTPTISENQSISPSDCPNLCEHPPVCGNTLNLLPSSDLGGSTILALLENCFLHSTFARIRMPPPSFCLFLSHSFSKHLFLTTPNSFNVQIFNVLSTSFDRFCLGLPIWFALNHSRLRLHCAKLLNLMNSKLLPSCLPTHRRHQPFPRSHSNFHTNEKYMFAPLLYLWCSLPSAIRLFS